VPVALLYLLICSSCGSYSENFYIPLQHFSDLHLTILGPAFLVLDHMYRVVN